MKHTVFALFLSTFFGLTPLALGAPPGNAPAQSYAGIVLLASPPQKVCGTGFRAPSGAVITNAHLARSLCPAGDCRGLVVRRASALGEPARETLEVRNPRVTAAYPGYDAALLDLGISGDAVSFGPAPEVGAAVRTVGFPDCGALRESTGVVTFRDALHLETSAVGRHGASGSPVFDDAGRIVGIVDEAATIGGAVGGSLLRSDFPLRAGRLDSIETLLAAPDSEELQLAALVEFLRALRREPLTRRLRGAMDFVVAGRELIDAAALRGSADAIGAIVQRGETILDSPLDPPLSIDTPAARLAESFAVGYALQFRSGLVSAGSLARYREESARRGRDTMHLAGLDTRITVFDLNIASVTLTVMFALIVIVTVRWGYQRVPLHGAARFAWLGALVVFWPFSLIVAAGYGAVRKSGDRTS